MVYAKEHFVLEERIMEKFGYPKYLQYLKQHRHFVEFIHQRNEDAKSGDMTAIYRLLNDLKTWLFSHITIEDKNLGLILKERQNDIMGYVRELTANKIISVKKSQLTLYNRVIGLSNYR
jgi:hemerythrin